MPRALIHKETWDENQSKSDCKVKGINSVAHKLSFFLPLSSFFFLLLLSKLLVRDLADIDS